MKIKQQQQQQPKPKKWLRLPQQIGYNRVTWGDPACMLEVSSKFPGWVSWASLCLPLSYSLPRAFQGSFLQAGMLEEPQKVAQVEVRLCVTAARWLREQLFRFFPSGWWCTELKRPEEKGVQCWKSSSWQVWVPGRSQVATGVVGERGSSLLEFLCRGHVGQQGLDALAAWS